MNEAPVLIQARVLIPGLARGEALVLEESLSFWGGFDPAEGRIIDVHHPQYRQQVAGKILFRGWNGHQPSQFQPFQGLDLPAQVFHFGRRNP